MFAAGLSCHVLDLESPSKLSTCFLLIPRFPLTVSIGSTYRLTFALARKKRFKPTDHSWISTHRHRLPEFVSTAVLAPFQTNEFAATRLMQRTTIGAERLSIPTLATSFKSNLPNGEVEKEVKKNMSMVDFMSMSSKNVKSIVVSSS